MKRDISCRYGEFPKFALGFTGDLTHADNNPGQYIDSDLVELLRFLKDNGHLDNTMLVVMGDHGARYSAVRWYVSGRQGESHSTCALYTRSSLCKQLVNILLTQHVN